MHVALQAMLVFWCNLYDSGSRLATVNAPDEDASHASYLYSPTSHDSTVSEFVRSPRRAYGTRLRKEDVE